MAVKTPAGGTSKRNGHIHSDLDRLTCHMEAERPVWIKLKIVKRLVGGSRKATKL